MNFTNPYNGQNGMSGIGPPDGMTDMGGPPNSMNNSSSYNYNTGRSQQTPNVNGWKAYNPDPPPPPPKPIVGRWVDSFDEIKPQEVAMDGEMHFFPQSDNSCVYAKFWTNDGRLLSFRFLPEKEDRKQPQQAVPQDISDIMRGYEIVTERLAERLETLEGAVNDIYNAVTQPTVRSKKNH